jgi:hypothetical protein
MSPGDLPLRLGALPFEEVLVAEFGSSSSKVGV